jgi:hypothetical protein
VHPNPFHSILHVLGFELNTMNMSYHHSCLRIDAMLEWCFPFLVCFRFSPVGSGVDVSNETDIKIDNTEDQYLSINEQFKKENPGYLFYFGYQQPNHRTVDPLVPVDAMNRDR